MTKDKMLLSIKEKVEREEVLTRIESAFLYKCACENVQQVFDDAQENSYRSVYLAYELMKNLLIEMKENGDLEKYDTRDVFGVIKGIEN